MSLQLITVTICGIKGARIFNPDTNASSRQDFFARNREAHLEVIAWLLRHRPAAAKGWSISFRLPDAWCE